ncbi:hypothetical protein ABW20_dc0103642 [Dactylellina cionopaga]|nr:hypothetical protein ABW20_dc0103642 [Dactylellina cionopaga]
MQQPRKSPFMRDIIPNPDEATRTATVPSTISHDSAEPTRDTSFHRLTPNNEAPYHPPSHNEVPLQAHALSHNEALVRHAGLSHNEELLTRGMYNLGIDSKSSRYQEHVCAEDFYRVAKRLYGNVIVGTSGDQDKPENTAKEIDNIGRESLNNWRFESAVVWNEGSRVKREAENSVPKDSRKIDERDLLPSPPPIPSKDDVEMHMNPARPVSEVVPISSSQAPQINLESGPDIVDIKAKGVEIYSRITNSKDGWRYTFELFELGKVPDTVTFVAEVLEEFISRRGLLWTKQESPDFELNKYRGSDDDDLFLQLSYTEATIEALKKGDLDRAGKLLDKVKPLLMRRLKRNGEKKWVYMIEMMEWFFCSLYLRIKRALQGSDIPIVSDELYCFSTDVELDGIFKNLMLDRHTTGHVWALQEHFIMDLLRGEFRSLENWEPEFNFHPMEEVRDAATDIEGIGLLRLEAEKAAIKRPENWSNQLKSWTKISPEALYKLSVLGHKRMILENLENLYESDPETQTAATSLPPERPPVVPNWMPPRPISLSEPTRNLASKDSLADKPTPAWLQTQQSVGKPLPQGDRLEPGRAQKPQTSRSAPVSIQGSTLGSPDPQNLYGLDSAPGPSGVLKPRQSSLAQSDQSQRGPDNCTEEELAAVAEFKQAVRNSVVVDDQIGKLASLGLINFISGNPEWKPWTPLIEAICNQRFAVAKILIKLGASFTLGYPLHTALSRHVMEDSRRRCQRVIDKGLLNPGDLPTEKFFYYESFSLIKFMIEAGAEVDKRGRANTDNQVQIRTTPVHLAALDPRADMLILLMLYCPKGCWLEDENGESPIDYAKRAGNVENWRFLVQSNQSIAMVNPTT